MGMDNTFFRVKKEDFQENKGDIFDLIYTKLTYEDCKLVYFRKEYILNEAIEEMKGYVDYTTINKNELDEIISKLKEKIKEKYQQEEYDSECMKLDKTIDCLSIIYDLFDFEKYVLIYERCG